MPRRPRVVVVSTFPVHPRSFGGQLRAFHLYGSLTATCDVTVVSLDAPGGSARTVDIAPGFSEVLVPCSPRQARLEAEATAGAGGFVGDVLAGVLTPLHTPAYLEALRGVAQHAALVVLAQPYMLPSVRTVAPHVPLVYDAYNVEVRLKEALLPRSAQHFLDLTRELEGGAVAAAAQVFACSRDDAAALAAEFGIDPDAVGIVPNGVDVSGLRFCGGEERARRHELWVQSFRRAGGWDGARHMALFLGSDHAPNVEACERLLGLVPQLDGVLLTVAGWVGNPFLAKGPSLAQAVFHGPFTDDAKRVLLGSAAVALNPVLRGSGTNLKTLEYFAAGIPVVATPVGARGLDVRHGEHLRIAAIDDFGEAITAVLDSPAESVEMAVRARRLVEQRYAWPVVARPFLADVASLTLSRRT